MEPPRRFRLYRLFARLVLMFIAWLFSTIQFTKTEVAQMYGVSIQTLNKWVTHFCPNINSQSWKRKRLLNLEWVNRLFTDLGMPNKSMTLSKGEIIQKCETYYKTLKQNIERLFCKMNISEEAYKKIGVFPPVYTQMILCKMG